MAYFWECLTLTAAFSGRDGAAAVVHNDKMFLLGGYLPGPITYNQVYSSTDGINWTLENGNTPWTRRHSFPAVSFNGRIYLMGGDPFTGVYQTDVWSSADGVTWQQETANAPWGNRVLHFGAAFAGYIWVWGGQTFSTLTSPPSRFYYDAWRSLDGQSWEKVGGNMPWGLRSAVVGSAILNNELYVYGGGAYETTDWPVREFRNDVWKTSDGINWQLVTGRAQWSPRMYTSMEAFDNKLWLIGGYSGSDLSEAWSSPDGKDWTKEPTQPWMRRHAASVFNYNDAIYLAGGSHYGRDVWKMTSLDSGKTHYNAVPDTTTGFWGVTHTMFDRTIALTPGKTVSLIGMKLNGSCANFKVKIGRENSASNFDVVYSSAAMPHPGGGYFDVSAESFVVPNDGGTYRIGYSAPLPTTPEVFCTQGSRSHCVGDAIGNNLAFIANGDGTVALRWIEP